ncbi:hypothetical protein NXX42_02985 [Bacteroides thetaiotaomicron]|nr:hypothetical protein [Bacteroides thetaiotaomicron]
MKLGGVFIIAVIASLSLQAQTTVEEANGTIRATASQPSQGRGRTGGFYFGRNHPRPFVQRIAGSRTRCHRQSGESVGTAFHLHQ